MARAREMLRRLYRATWGRAVAWGYDRFVAATEDAGLRDRRRELLAPATGRCLEIGAGTGLNLEAWPALVEPLVLTEPDPHMAAQLRKRVARSPRSAEVVEAPGERLPFADAELRLGGPDARAVHRPGPCGRAARGRSRAQAGRTPLLPRARAGRGSQARPLAGQATRTLVRVRLRMQLQPADAGHDRDLASDGRARPARRAAEGAADRAAADLGSGARGRNDRHRRAAVVKARPWLRSQPLPTARLVRSRLEPRRRIAPPAASSP